MDDKKYNNIYAIPANYTDSGKLLGGMLEIRNTIEVAILLLLVGYPELIKGIPNLHLFIFGGGLIASITLLIVLKIRDRGKHKKRDEFSDSDE